MYIAIFVILIAEYLLSHYLATTFWQQVIFKLSINTEAHLYHLTMIVYIII